MIPLRYVPPVLLVLLIVTKVIFPAFLAQTLWGPISWFSVIFVPLLYVSAALLTPAFVAIVNRMAATWFVLPIVFIVVILGLLALGDLLVNGMLHALDVEWRLRMFETVTSIFTGGT